MDAVTEPRLVTVGELEMMSPEERRQLHDERIVTDLSQVDPEFLARVRADVRTAVEKRRALDRKR